MSSPCGRGRERERGGGLVEGVKGNKRNKEDGGGVKLPNNPAGPIISASLSEHVAIRSKPGSAYSYVFPVTIFRITFDIVTVTRLEGSKSCPSRRSSSFRRRCPWVWMMSSNLMSLVFTLRKTVRKKRCCSFHTDPLAKAIPRQQNE